MSDSRRSFITRAATGGAAIAAAGTATAAEAKPTADLIRVGVMAVGQYSHLNSKGSIWAPSMNPTEPGRWPGRTSILTITHCWDSRPEIAGEFAERYKCEAVAGYDDMVGKVDALVTGGMYECKWWPQLTRPYLEAGIPTFINRPFALSMKAAREMVERSRRHSAPIMSTDAHEDMKETIVARQHVEELRAAGKAILGADSTTGAHEYPAHMVHALFMVLSVFGLDVERVSLQAPGWWSEATPTNARTMDWGILALQYRGLSVEGAEPQTKPFLVTVHAIGGNYGSRATLRVYHTGGWQDFDHYQINARKNLIDQRYHLQAKTVFNLQRMFESGVMPASHDYILGKTRIFLAGFYSLLERDGRMTGVDEVPEDWEAPSPFPDWIDERIFG